MSRTHLRATAVVGVLGLGLLAAAPAMAATDNQAGANAVTLSVAGNANGTGLVTATYADGKETKTGATTPAFPNPGNQKVVTGGVLAQEATARPGFSAACAGLAGDGGSVINLGDSSCLRPGNLLTGSLGSFDLNSLLTASTAQLPDPLKTTLGQVTGGASAVTDAVNSALAQAKQQFGSGGLVADLDLIEGRCTAGDGGPTGSSTLTNAKIAASFGGQSVTLLNFPTNPAPNTHLITNLSAVLNLVLDGLDTDLKTSLNGGGAPLTALTDAIKANIVTQIHSQVEGNLKPLQDNVLDVTLNRQEHPTADSIKVRALDVQVLPALKSQLKGSSLVDLQVGNAACAPVARVAAAVSAPQAAPPKAKTPTAVSSGLATMPGQHDGIDPTTYALLALAGLGVVGAGSLGLRRIRS